MMRITSLAGLVAAVLLACAPPSTAKSVGDANVVTKEEILETHTSNLYDAISKLRPNFLHYRGKTTIRGADTGYPKVYLDRMLFGDINSLKNMNTNGIREIHFYNGSDAGARFGLDNVSGAIEIISDTSQ